MGHFGIRAGLCHPAAPWSLTVCLLAARFSSLWVLQSTALSLFREEELKNHHALLLQELLFFAPQDFL